ncbi:MAG: T9SS type A sorting domain-containing protein [Ignavibacteria bacterium]|jgi:photosystem II stability/assembly factor-like uncharacterized protein
MEKNYAFKRIILLEICILFLASSFPSDKSPGWVQQSVPTSKTINDIYFIDSLRGWAVTTSGSDTMSVILNTTNAGTNWNIQTQRHCELSAIQFVDSNIGYTVGGFGYDIILKTTNGGNTWNTILSGVGQYFTDLFFVNKDTGWVCDDDQFFGVGVIKTTNGGLNWTQQLGMNYCPSKLFFINKDTGWCATQLSLNNNPLMRTTNGGLNWTAQFTFPYEIEAIFFLNAQKGWVRDAVSSNGNGIAYTTNGGYNWTNAQGVICGFDVKFVNDSIGYSGIGGYHVAKSKDGGLNWYYQNCSIMLTNQIFAIKNDTLHAWTGESGIAYTNDGGGPILQITNSNEQISKDYILYQNHPNPFNAVSSIKYQVKRSTEIKILVFDITGKEIKTLVNKKQSPGEYEVKFDGNNLPSGVYFYSMFIDGIRVDTKKMVMIK